MLNLALDIDQYYIYFNKRSSQNCSETFSFLASLLIDTDKAFDDRHRFSSDAQLKCLLDDFFSESTGFSTMPGGMAVTGGALFNPLINITIAVLLLTMTLRKVMRLKARVC
jgi:hypothetical protein